MSLKLVISGGQNGVDLAALRAARDLDILTGGFMPKGWRTLDGPKPKYRQRYNMQEAPTTDYPTRTRMNVEAADFTLQIMEKVDSPGEQCTRRNVRQLRKPSLELVLVKGHRPVEEVAALIGNVVTLNVAGNSEQTCPGIGSRAYAFLLELFPLLSQRRKPK